MRPDVEGPDIAGFGAEAWNPMLSASALSGGRKNPAIIINVKNYFKDH